MSKLWLGCVVLCFFLFANPLLYGLCVKFHHLSEHIMCDNNDCHYFLYHQAKGNSKGKILIKEIKKNP